jgi:hypothetical protein
MARLVRVLGSVALILVLMVRVGSCAVLRLVLRLVLRDMIGLRSVAPSRTPSRHRPGPGRDIGGR